MLKGIDISKYQTTTPSLTGLSFVFVRALYGTIIDPRYSYHAANVKKAGLVQGAYCFGRNMSGSDQANTLLTIAKDADLLVLDLESDGTNPRMTDKQVKDFFDTIHTAGRTAGLYHSESGFPNLGQDWNWKAKWSATPPKKPWTFWQYRGSPLDLDYFDGTIDQLRILGDSNMYAIVNATLLEPANPRHWIVAKGVTLNGYDPAQPNKVVRTFTFTDVSGASTDALVNVTWVGAGSPPIPRGGPFLRVVDGYFNGLLIPANMVQLASPIPPVVDTKHSVVLTIDGKTVYAQAV